MVGILLEVLVETELILLATNEKELAGLIVFFFKPFLNGKRITISVKKVANISYYLRGGRAHRND